MSGKPIKRNNRKSDKMLAALKEFKGAPKTKPVKYSDSKALVPWKEKKQELQRINSDMQTQLNKRRITYKEAMGKLPKAEQKKLLQKHFKKAVQALQRDKKVQNVVVTRGKGKRGRGKIIGVNYDYTSRRNRNFVTVSLANDVMVVKTRTLVTTITTESIQTGEELYSVLINPTQSLGGIREQRFASCFDKYDIEYCMFQYNPASATSVSGNFYGGFDFDPTQYYPPSQEGLDKLLTKTGSHDCMFYGGGKPKDYYWEMPRYPGKKPTFFIDQTDGSGSAIRLANTAQFLLLNGFGIKQDELGVMGSLWCEMTTRFYDPYIQNIEGTYSTFLCNPSVTSMTLIAADETTIADNFNVASVGGTAGVEHSVSIPVFAKPGYYVPPGVWSIEYVFNGATDIASSGLATSSSFFALTLGWWNITKSTTNWQRMDITNLPEGNSAYRIQPSIWGTQTGTGIKQYPANSTAAFGRFIIPNDGLDYYIGFINLSTYYNDNVGTYLVSTVRNTLGAAVPSYIQFKWHAPDNFSSNYLSASLNATMVDRVQHLEQRYVEVIEKLKENHLLESKSLKSESKDEDPNDPRLWAGPMGFCDPPDDDDDSDDEKNKFVKVQKMVKHLSGKVQDEDKRLTGRDPNIDWHKFRVHTTDGVSVSKVGDSEHLVYQVRGQEFKSQIKPGAAVLVIQDVSASLTYWFKKTVDGWFLEHRVEVGYPIIREAIEEEMVEYEESLIKYMNLPYAPRTLVDIQSNVSLKMKPKPKSVSLK